MSERDATQLRVLVLLLCVSAECFSGCAKPTGAFVWDSPTISTGKVCRYSEWSGRVTWKVTGSRSVEIIGLRTSCGCVQAEPHLENGAPLTPGLYQAGSRGEVLLHVRPTRQSKDILAETVPMVWKFEGEAGPRFAEIQLQGQVVDSWQVDPAFLHLAGASCDDVPRFVIRWRALSGVEGRPHVVCEPPAVHLDPTQETLDEEGKRVIVVQGIVDRPEYGYEVAAMIHLIGVLPPAPDVPLRVDFARRVFSTPDSVVPLVQGTDGRFGAQVRVSTVDSAVGGAEIIARVEIAPTALAGNFDIKSQRVSKREVLLTLSCLKEVTPSLCFGSLVIHHGIGMDPPIRLLWYLRS